MISNMNRFSKFLVVFTSFYLCGTIGFAQTRSSLSNLDFELKRDSGLPSFFYVNEKNIKEGRYKV